MTLQYGSFATLGVWAKVVSLTTGLLKRVADQALRGDLFLDELKREHQSGRQLSAMSGGLFLLERLFHNTAAWQRTEQQ